MRLRLMLADRPHPQTLPLLSAFLCVLGAGLASSLVFQMLGLWATRPALEADPELLAVVLSFVGPLVSGWAVRLLLRNIFGFAIPYWRAYWALVVGDLLSAALLAVLLGLARHSASTAGAVALPGLLGPGLLGTIVTVYLIQRAATPVGYRAPAVAGTALQRHESAPRIGVSDRDLYDEAVSGARDASIGLVDLLLSVPPTEAPHLIANGLPGLELATRTLERQTCPVRELLDCHQRLVQGLRQLADDLVEAAEAAGLSASDQLVERGAFFPSMADVSDHGARYRWSLSQSAGVKAVRDALEEMGRHGIGTTW
jgi:hypothetical protein